MSLIADVFPYMYSIKAAYIDSPKTGLSDYLGRKTDAIDNAVVEAPQCPGLYILPVGTLPPNPTELLAEDRFGKLIAQLRSQYDYIFIDCPPIEIVADTQIIEQVADRTLFVVRAGLLERGMLAELESIYQEKRFKNMAVILNGTLDGNNRYGYKYGYKYGYHYGYGSSDYYGKK